MLILSIFTGVSLHCPPVVASQLSTNDSQRARLHITLEFPWSAEKAIQQIGSIYNLTPDLNVILTS